MWDVLNYVYVVYGPAVIEHSLLVTDILPNSKIGKDIDAGKGLFKKILSYDKRLQSFGYACLDV